MEDKRRFRRINVPFDVVLSAEGGPEIPCGLRDVSIQGIYVTCEACFDPGTVAWFRIMLQGGSHDIEILGKGEVVRVEHGGMAIHFKAIDPESVHQLRNLIALNADDPSEAWEEMQGGHDLRAARERE